MPRLSPLSFREVKQKLEAAGFVEVRRRGSHAKFTKRIDERVVTTIVPFRREVTVGTLRGILRQSGLSVEEFRRL